MLIYIATRNRAESHLSEQVIFLMKIKKLFILWVCVVIFLASFIIDYNVNSTASSHDGMVSEREYEQHAIFGDDAFELYWSIFDDEIEMAMVGKTEGWIAIGFEPNETKVGADMLFGWVEDDGEPKTLDCYAQGFTSHPPDIDLGGTNDITSFNGTEKNGTTIIELSRRLSTGDNYDKDIPLQGNLSIIWAIGSTDNYTEKHAKRGSGTLNLSQPSIAELDGIIEDDEYDYVSNFERGRFKLYWKIKGNNIQIAMEAQTTGWLAIGFKPATAPHKDADMIFGWVNNRGNVMMVDAYSPGTYGPHPADTEMGGIDNIISYGGTEKDGFTIIEFVRALSTGDQYDKDIPREGELDVIWSYGSTDDWTNKHTEAGTGTISIDTGITLVPVTIWPIHAMLMISGLTFLLSGLIVARQKEGTGWMKIHRTMEIIGSSIIFIGSIIGIYMVEVSGSDHFRFPHAIFGFSIPILTAITLYSGLTLARPGMNPKLKRKIHKIIAWILVIIMFGAVIEGFFAAGIW
jgi:hypothetical protein